MGNLLTYEESLRWEDRDLDRGRFVMELNDAILKARSEDHSIWMTPTLMNLTLSWGSFFQFLWEKGADESYRIQLFPWLTQIQYEVLCRIFYSIGPPTNQSSNNIEELENEFQGDNNGLIGFEVAAYPDKYVYNLISLEDWNSQYLKLYPEFIEWRGCGSDYFPQIKKTLLYLEQEIKKHHEDEEVAKFMKKHENNIGVVYYEEVMKKKSVEDKIAYAEVVGNIVAEINFYSFEEDISKAEFEATNKKRRVFGIIKNGSKQYLSIDFEKGMFEVLNDRGVHLGEYRFCGTKNKDADKDGNHDLKSL